MADARQMTKQNSEQTSKPENSMDGKTKAMLVVLIMGTFSTSYCQSMMNIALPNIAHRFSVTLSIANWMVVGFTVVAATFVIIAAALLKRIGLHKLFIVASLAMAIGSLIGIFSFDFFTLLIARLVQAISTGLIFPVVTGVIVAIVPKSSRGAVLATNSSLIGIGLAVGSLISGLILTYVNISIMFVVPTALGILLLLGTLKLVHDVGERQKAHIDGLSILLSFLGLAALMYGFSEITHLVLPASIAFGVGVVFAALFVWRQLRLKQPLLNIRPLREKKFSVGIGLIMLGFIASSALSLLLPLYYEGYGHFSAFVAGLFVLAPVLVYAVLSVFGGKIYDRHGIWPLVTIGFCLVTGGFIGVFFAAAAHSLIAVIILSCVAYGGVGFIIAPDKSTALGELPKPLYSDGASINSTFVQIAESIGSALFVGVLSSDVLRLTASHLSSADAYAEGFSHTILISIGFAVAGIIVSIIYSRIIKHSKA